MKRIYLGLAIHNHQPLGNFPWVFEDAYQRAYLPMLRQLTFDRLAALPYAGLPIGTVVSLQTGRPLIYPRKEVKDYGTERSVEGAFERGQIVLLIDDLITRGHSKLEAIAPLEAAGLKVNDILVLVDREQGGVEELDAHGYAVHAVLTLAQILDALVGAGKLTAARRDKVKTWLMENR